jgi:ribonuclease D
LWEQLRYTPCSPKCANWLRYGIQPKGARAKLRAGHCKAKVHQLDTLAIGGRRVLVSRDWSGKTLADHRYDQLACVRKLLQHQPNDGDEDQAQTVDAARQRLVPDPISWTLARPTDPGVPDLSRRLLRMISTRIQQRAAVQAAKLLAAEDGPPENRSATNPPEQRRAARRTSC